MRSDRVGELGIVVDLADRADDFRRDLLVELDVVLKLRDHRARQRLDLDRVLFGLGELDGVGLVIVFAVGVARRSPRARPSTSTLTVPSGSLSSCSTLAMVPML
jgi:hypothetical protein